MHVNKKKWIYTVHKISVVLNIHRKLKKFYINNENLNKIAICETLIRPTTHFMQTLTNKGEMKELKGFEKKQ